MPDPESFWFKLALVYCEPTMDFSVAAHDGFFISDEARLRRKRAIERNERDREEEKRNKISRQEINERDREEERKNNIARHENTKEGRILNKILHEEEDRKRAEHAERERAKHAVRERSANEERERESAFPHVRGMKGASQTVHIGTCRSLANSKSLGCPFTLPPPSRRSQMTSF